MDRIDHLELQRQALAGPPRRTQTPWPHRPRRAAPTRTGSRHLAQPPHPPPPSPKPRLLRPLIRNQPSSVPPPVAIPVARIDPLRRALTIGRATDRVRLSAHQRLSDTLHHLPQQVRALLLQPLAQPPQRVDAVLDHRRLLSEVFGQNSLRMTRWSPPLQGGAPRRRRRPPSAQSGR